MGLRLTHEQSTFSYFNISSDFLSLFLKFYAPLNLDQSTRVKRRPHLLFLLNGENLWDAPQFISL